MKYTVSNFIKTILAKPELLLYEYVDLATVSHMFQIVGGVQGAWVVLPSDYGTSFRITPITENTDFNQALGVINPTTDVMYKWPYKGMGILRFTPVEFIEYVRKDIL